MLERKNLPLQIKRLNSREFDGYGSVAGNVDLGGDVIMPGAFKRTLAEHRTRQQLAQMFWMHDPSRVPGKWLEMTEDENGLYVKGVLADTDLGNEIHTLLNMDAVRGLSIGFVTKDQEFEDDGTRLIKDVDLWEVSIVSLPMNPLAQVAHVKSRLSAAGEYVPTMKEFERVLRDAGCSRSVAKQIVYNIKSIRETDEPREMPGEQRKAEVSDDEMTKLADFADNILAETIRLRFAA